MSERVTAVTRVDRMFDEAFGAAAEDGADGWKEVEDDGG